MKTFNELGLNEKLVKGLSKKNIDRATNGLFIATTLPNCKQC